jgi:pyocin large subunit-like protein
LNGLRNGLPVKISKKDGCIRLYDPERHLFGSYNADGTARTFYRPDKPKYWDGQGGSAPWTP